MHESHLIMLYQSPLVACRLYGGLLWLEKLDEKKIICHLELNPYIVA